MSEENKIKELEKLIDRFKSCVDTLQAGINIVNKDGIIIYVNEAYCQMHKYSKEELIGSYLDKILSKNYQINGLKNYKEIISKKISRSPIVKGYNSRSDGSTFPVLISWNFLEINGQLDGMVSVIQDISEIEKMQKALEESKVKYQNLVESISDVIWEINEKGEYTYISPKVFDIMEYHPQDCLGKTIWQLGLDSEMTFPQQIQDAVKNKKNFNKVEVKRKRKNNEIVILESSGVPVFDNQNNYTGFRGNDRDITVFKTVKEKDREIKNLKEKLKNRDYLRFLMGESEIISEVHKDIEKVAKTDFSVLIQGETGTGKEIIAEAIHNFSNRNKKELISIDCGALSETIFESELFGHIKGAFTGAMENKEGAFQLANGGTLFLDEITNLSVRMQQKLLRVLQEKQVQRLGSLKKEQLDIRIIVATNENIIDSVNNGSFRKDLFFRLNEFYIKIPPLRERREDIPVLVKRFINEICRQLKCEVKRIKPEVMQLLLKYNWPGNVRELKNALKRAILVSDHELKPKHFELFSEHYAKPDNNRENPLDINTITQLDLKNETKKYAEKYEKEIIIETLKRFNNNKSKTARFLNIDYKTMLTKINYYNLE